MNKINYYQSRKIRQINNVAFTLFFLGWSYGSNDSWGTIPVLFPSTFGGLGSGCCTCYSHLNKKSTTINRRIAINLDMSNDDMRMLGI